ncbi:MAG: hypothetical protein BZY81_02150 [SAR202 cluster bacterium Io17-Chloro-G4]|nr:MAG: hypothetical protein BZY81_02150 [SAR202 cluster bacterium Io17-Chloro-G4]
MRLAYLNLLARIPDTPELGSLRWILNCHEFTSNMALEVLSPPNRDGQFMVSTEPYLVPDFAEELKNTGGLTISLGVGKWESTSVRVNHAKPGLQEGLKGILAGCYVKPVGHLLVPLIISPL